MKSKFMLCFCVIIAVLVLCVGCQAEPFDAEPTPTPTQTPEATPTPSPSPSPTPEPSRGITQAEPWMEAFFEVLKNENLSNPFDIILIDVDFDNIPEMFLTENQYASNFQIRKGFKFNNGECIEIMHDEGFLGEIKLFRKIETDELVWLSYGFARLNYLDAKWQWNIVDFSNFSDVTTKLFFGFIEERIPTDNIDNFEHVIKIMNSKNDYIGGFEIDLEFFKSLYEEVFTEYEEIMAKKRLSYFTNFVADDLENRTLMKDILMDFFFEWID